MRFHLITYSLIYSFTYSQEILMLEKDVSIHENESIKDALKRLDKTAEKVLLVVDLEKRLLGAITDGDIRRYLLKGKSLENCIREVYNKKPIYIKKEDYSLDKVKKILIKNKVGLLPILDIANKVVDFVTWNQVFAEDKVERIKKSKIDVPIVIMAGGKGTRLEPFTKILPKPLIPIGDDPVIEIIMKEFRRQGGGEYYVVLNYKGEMIKSYFVNIENDYEIKYIWENDFCGTAGSLKLINEAISDTFIVSNCDVIVKANFEEVIGLHREQNASITILSSIQHYKIPYGVVNFKEKGVVTDILEKPEYTITVNTGVYVLSKDILRFIPDHSYFDMTDLIRTLIENSKKVITYPVNENDYIDIGQWGEYKKAVEKLQFINYV